jgi:carbamoyl-phosphate synthase small subunit
MNGIISTIDSNLESLKKKLSQAPSMTRLDLAQKVTCKDSYLWSTIQNGQYKVAAIDFGIKHNILRLLESHGCNVTVFLPM